jgi:hypothetical protein
MILLLLSMTFLAYAADEDNLFCALESDDWVRKQVLLYRQKHPKKDIAFGISQPVGGFVIEINEYVQENGKKKRSNITVTSPHLEASLQAIHAYMPVWRKIIADAKQRTKNSHIH